VITITSTGSGGNSIAALLLVVGSLVQMPASAGMQDSDLSPIAGSGRVISEVCSPAASDRTPARRGQVSTRVAPWSWLSENLHSQCDAHLTRRIRRMALGETDFDWRLQCRPTSRSFRCIPGLPRETYKGAGVDGRQDRMD